ncbi:DinB family protein [Croceitalea rosinachiae]|uniref:DinB family protein n=1 Tax=Croceitalea rosinachiae TaxID=3075596 RepID=A0ABU3AGZ1_9FLAO|nr:DinB family protein [Croceitalea sp. F388]MDT0608368.1 DinB family protein [Croceitalea sp. F388]
MFSDFIIAELEQHKKVFETLLVAVTKETHLFRPSPDSWCLLEVTCHLRDEEVYDFRARVRHALEAPNALLKPISPKTWPLEHDYLNKDFQKVTRQFLEERSNSIAWLKGLKNASWNNKILHPDLGELSARTFLENWLAHDYLHIRQINKIKRAYLSQVSNDDLSYAGNW